MAKRGTTKFHSNMQEKIVAEELKGRVQLASGAFDDKADVRTPTFLVECKTTEKNYYPLKYEVWNKIYSEANKLGLCPVMCVEVCNTFYFEARRYCILRKRDFEFYVLSAKRQEDFVSSEPRILIQPRCFKKQIKTCDEMDKGIYHEYFSDYLKDNFSASLIVFPWEHFLELINGGDE